MPPILTRLLPGESRAHAGVMRSSSALLCSLFAVILCDAQAQVGGCSVTTLPLSFGSYDVSAVAPLVTSSKIEVRCATPTTLTIGIDRGNGAPASGSGRALRHINHTDVLLYNVYQDASLSLEWGTGMTSAGRALRVATSQTIFAYGALPAGQDVRFGEYRDALSVVVMP